jgi:hypothetical protein
MKKFKIYLSLLLMVMAFSTCDDLLDTEPRQSVSVQGALESPEVLTALLINAYNDFQGGGNLGSAWIVHPEIIADNFKFNDNRGTYRGQFQNTQGTHMTAWGNYGTLLPLNVIIEGADVLDDKIVGEAYTLRALSYFYLMNVYAYMPTAVEASQNRGGVPLITDAVLSLQDITLPARASIDEVYDFMLTDIERAIALLDNTGTKARITRAAAQALGSRIALYAGEWQLSIDYAQAAIDANVGTFSSRASYASDWLSSSVNPESIWYLEYQNNENQGPNTSLQSIYLSGGTNRSPNYRGNGDYTPTDEVLSLYQAGDVRNDILIAVSSAGLNNAVGTRELHKYNGNTGLDNADNIPIFRVSEMYLNIAEAAARSGQTALAQSTLEILKQRSVDPAYTATNTGQALIDEILLERRLELLGEGHRLFDLKRNGLDIDKTATDLTGELIPFSDLRILAPLPQGDLNLNPNLQNNFGY